MLEAVLQIGQCIVKDDCVESLACCQCTLQEPSVHEKQHQEEGDRDYF